MSSLSSSVKESSDLIKLSKLSGTCVCNVDSGMDTVEGRTTNMPCKQSLRKSFRAVVSFIPYFPRFWTAMLLNSPIVRASMYPGTVPGPCILRNDFDGSAEGLFEALGRLPSGIVFRNKMRRSGLLSYSLSNHAFSSGVNAALGDFLVLGSRFGGSSSKDLVGTCIERAC